MRRASFTLGSTSHGCLNTEAPSGNLSGSVTKSCQGRDGSGGKPKPPGFQINQCDPLKPVPGYIARCRVPFQPLADGL